MRLFIAINFDDKIKNYLKNIQQSLKGITKNGSFTREENFHLTLVFLGEVSSKQVPAIKHSMDMIQVSAFELTIGGIGCFRRDGSNIVWIGVKQGSTLTDSALTDSALTAIYNELCVSLSNGGFVIEKRDYKPHLTLAREAVFTGDVNSVSAPVITAQVNKISLMKSERTDGKLIYTEIYTKELKT